MLALLLPALAPLAVPRVAGGSAAGAGEARPPAPFASRALPVSVRFAALARDGEQVGPLVPPSPAGLRIWSDGDSVSYFMTTNLFAILSEYGAEPVRAADYKISSRLADPSGSSAILGVPFSWWLTYIPQEMERYDPDIVVLLVGANDAVFVPPEVYGERASEVMDLLAGSGRLLVWVGLPSFLREDLAANAPALNAMARAEAESRSWVLYVDTSGIQPDGGDGVHFGPGRAREIAEAVIEALFPGVLDRAGPGWGTSS